MARMIGLALIGAPKTSSFHPMISNRKNCLSRFSSRKRRTSYTQDEREYLYDGDDMDECNAALVLMSLSCSPNSNSPRQGESFFVSLCATRIWTG
jgi:hypothetical protein